MHKLLRGFGTLAIASIPIVGVVSCGSSKTRDQKHETININIVDNENESPEHEEQSSAIHNTQRIVDGLKRRPEYGQNIEVAENSIDDGTGYANPFHPNLWNNDIDSQSYKSSMRRISINQENQINENSSLLNRSIDMINVIENEGIELAKTPLNTELSSDIKVNQLSAQINGVDGDQSLDTSSLLPLKTLVNQENTNLIDKLFNLFGGEEQIT